jgi:hypothetical protein
MRINNLLKNIIVSFLFSLIFLFTITLVYAETTKTLNPSEDSYVDSEYNPRAFGTNSQLQVYNHPGTPINSMITYMKFDLSSIPSSATINSATLGVYATSCGGTTANKLYVGSVKSSWNETQLVWSNKPTYVANFSSISIPGEDSSGYKQWSIKQLVDNWVSGRSTNYGLSIYFGSDSNMLCQFSSSESANNKPYLTIKYTLPITAHITALTATNITSSSARISWITDFRSDTYVYYGLPNTQALLKGTNESVTEHVYTLINLQPATKYLYRAVSKDTNGTTITSDAAYFTTNSAPPPIAPVTLVRDPLNIHDVTVTELGHTSARISWQTNRNANTTLSFGRNAYGIEGGTNESSLVTDHSVLLNNLTAGSDYFFKLGAESADRVVASEYSGIFTTISEEQTPDTTTAQTDNTASQNLETEPGPYPEALVDTPSPTQEKITTLPNSETKLTGFQEFASSAFSSPFVMALLSPGTFMLFPLVIFIVFIILVIKIFKKKTSVPPLEPTRPVDSDNVTQPTENKDKALKSN